MTPDRSSLLRMGDPRSVIVLDSRATSLRDCQMIFAGHRTGQCGTDPLVRQSLLRTDNDGQGSSQVPEFCDKVAAYTRATASSQREAPNSETSLSRARTDLCAAAAGSFRIALKPRAMAAGCSEATKIAVSGVTTSGTPPTAVAMIGTCASMASSRVIGVRSTQRHRTR